MNWIDQDDGTSDCAGFDAAQLAGVLEEYQEALRLGRPIDRNAFLTEHAALADRLADCLEALEWIQSVAEGSSANRERIVSQSSLPPGDVLGDFRILREVGRGGMGVVYEAEQLCQPARRVALKVLAGASSLDARSLRRFRVETQAAACLNHPNIVPVFAAGCERGIPFYSMPLIKGRSLAEILRTLRSGDRATMPACDTTGYARSPEAFWPVVVGRLGHQAAEALEHAHSSGVIHRDIKPSNLIVDAEGRLWVTDFGLARLTRDDTAPTRTGDLVGTLRYMSPEQVRGESCAGDSRSDIYSLGVTLYEACTLHPAFEETDRSALLHQILNHEPPAPRTIAPTIPKDLETIVLKAMDKLPAGRYASAREMADDLCRFLEDRPIHARRPSLVERSLRWSKRHRTLLATAVAGIVVSMGIASITLWRAKRQAEANLVMLKDARNSELRAFAEAFGINDRITVPLIHEATATGLWDEELRLQSYSQLIDFYDRIAKSFVSEDPQLEAVAKAVRRAGALRMTLGDRRGRDDYARAIGVYEALSARVPGAIWYRTDLISTLREYASRLQALGDREAAATRHRRAFEIADGLLADQHTKRPCFRKEAIPEFDALLELLSDVPEATAADRALADRLTNWLNENR
jgi:eukaryotic-like serine/threonine-protein kinase